MRYRVQVFEVSLTDGKLLRYDETLMVGDSKEQAATFAALHFGLTSWDWVGWEPKDWMAATLSSPIRYVLFVTECS